MTVFKNEPGTRTINVPAGSYDVITIDYTGNLSGEMWLMGDVAVSNLTLNAASKVESIIFDTHQLRGTSGNDKFDFTGIEYMEGQLSAIKLGGGNDTFSAGSAGVWVDGGSGNDTLYGGGIDQLLGGSGDDVIHGGTGSNELSGGTGKDIFVAATRNNTFDNDSLNTITDFVAGADRIDVSAYGISSFRQLQHILDSSSGGHAHFEARFGDSLNSFTLEGIAKGKLSAVDFIFFTGKAVEIVGTDEDDRLFAGSKGSVLKGGFGNNELFGGTGADVFVVSAKSGENTGQNTIFDFSTSTDRIDISAYGISGFNQLKRILESKSGDTYFSPEMAIYPLSDVTIKGIDANKLSARDFIFYTGENKQIAGNDWDDRLFAAAGGSTLKGGGGFDSLYGGDRNDVLDGGKFSDIAYGGKGDDVYVLESSEDRAIESKNEGIDLVKTYWDNTTLSANIENLTLLGHANSGTGNDLDNIIRATSAGNSLKGMKGNDTLIGGADWDTLDGGVGADTMSGGKEDDTCPSSNDLRLFGLWKSGVSGSVCGLI